VNDVLGRLVRGLANQHLARHGLALKKKRRKKKRRAKR